MAGRARGIGTHGQRPGEKAGNCRAGNGWNRAENPVGRQPRVVRA